MDAVQQPGLVTNNQPQTGALPDGLTLSSDIDLFIPASLPSHLRGMIYSFNTMRG